jgi:hypothetical protein
LANYLIAGLIISTVLLALASLFERDGDGD